MSASILPFPARRRPIEPDSFQVVFDMGRWSVAFFERERFRYRAFFDSEANARDMAVRLVVGRGLHWRDGGAHEHA